jgi:hypothetical protein
VHVIGNFIDFDKGDGFEGGYDGEVSVILSNDGKKAYLSDGDSGIYVINVCE